MRAITKLDENANKVDAKVDKVDAKVDKVDATVKQLFGKSDQKLAALVAVAGHDTVAPRSSPQRPRGAVARSVAELAGAVHAARRRAR